MCHISMMSFVYLIAGCNGAGKTTASRTILPEIINCNIFINADDIAKDLNPKDPDAAAFTAGRTMLQQLEELISKGVDFAFETTLSTKTYQFLIDRAKARGYKVVLIYFWLESIELAQQRVRDRVRKGGHNIPNEIIGRRYKRGLENFFKIYNSICNPWILCNNSDVSPSLIARMEDTELVVGNVDIWNRLIREYE